MYSHAVFNSHFCAFALGKPLISLVASTDQSDTFCPTVFRNVKYFVRESAWPRGEVRVGPLVVVTKDKLGHMFVVWL